MTLLLRAPLPMQDKVINPPRWKDSDPKGPDPLAYLLTAPLADYFTRQDAVLEQTAQRANVVDLSDQAGSIAATDFSEGSTSAGLWRVQYYAAITRAATTSSSLEVQIDWVHGGISKSVTSAAVTGNTVTSLETETLLIRVDKNSPIRYTTTYASAGATSMLYSLDLVLEFVRAA